MKPQLMRAALLAAILIVPAPALAEEVTLVADRDNTLYEALQQAGGEGEEPPSNGAGDYFFAGMTAETQELRRGLVRFDVAAEIPAGAVVESAQLALEMSRTIAGTVPVTIHRVLTDWGEGTSDAPGEEGQGAPAEQGDATWFHTFHPSDFWASQGGDFAPAASAVQNVGGVGSYVWGSTAEMVVDVQTWLDSPAENFGWIVVGGESAAGNGGPSAKRFNTHENPDAASRPMLVIQYSMPVPTAPAWVLLGLALVLWASAWWHGRRSVGRAGEIGRS